MGNAGTFLCCYPSGKYGIELLAKRLDRTFLYLPLSFDYEEIKKEEEILWNTLKPEDNQELLPWIEKKISLCEAALEHTRQVIGNTPISIDYTFHPRPLGLAKLLLTHGFNVETVYLDSISPEEKEAFAWLKEKKPELELRPTVHAKMRLLHEEHATDKILAIGQKAAWFTGSRYFVNLVQGAGLQGFDGIRRTAELMEEAFSEEKDPKTLIVKKDGGVQAVYETGISNYTDLYLRCIRVCSALYELGGMVVIHDPSGCNSTYNTHDEIRWYNQDSLIFISGLTEIDAVMGNDEKFLSDIKEAAGELHPKFIALVSSPIPFMNGTDFPALAKVLETETGLPSFAVPTNGMHDYVYGAGIALEKLQRGLLATAMS